MLLFQLSHGCEISNVIVEILVGPQLSEVRGHNSGQREEGDGFDAKLKTGSHQL